MAKFRRIEALSELLVLEVLGELEVLGTRPPTKNELEARLQKELCDALLRLRRDGEVTMPSGKAGSGSVQRTHV